jgi:hypothetical protein
MVDKYRVQSDGRVFGPFTAERLVDLLVDGKVGEDAMVCPQGETEWVPWSSVPALGGEGEVDGSVVEEDVESAGEYMDSLFVNGEEDGGEPDGDDEDTYAIHGATEVAQPAGSGIPLPGVATRSAATDEQSANVAPVTNGAAAAGPPEMTPEPEPEPDSEWDVVEEDSVVADREVAELVAVDVDAPGFLVEVSSYGISEREFRLMVVVGLWGLGILSAGFVVSFTRYFALDLMRS